ncbi:MAG: efflux RND transporter permease subunit [Candidatus Dadabacteria bacterium]|nr:efflux RND transporter permease subunit [Candidatus Dadabacteria bacterium]MYA47914.1 efflux RND transporter permease subunit [Candidatus Dadabacteria bacterium]MYF48318.1 efflux RND transporter permease subunit [Candidatus Dadabacteria bacterium]MYK49306.1 efflux RND transporter permease subunit [Candidatus Dadabacteria bacterium]
MHIADFSVRNSFFVNLLMGAIIFIGLLLAFSLPLELFPSVKLEMVTVTTSFPGSSAEDVENLVSVPIEQQIKNISGVKIVKSISSEGFSRVTAEVYPGEDTRRVAWDIDSRINLIADDLPEDAEEPVTKEEESSYPLVGVSVSGDMPRDILYSSARRLRDEIALLDGIDSVTSVGLPDPAIWVYLDYPKMVQFGVGIEEISDAINAKNLDIPGANFTRNSADFLLRTEGKIRSVEDLLDIPVARSVEGKHVLLRDVATVALGEQRENLRSRINGRPAITFWVEKQKNVDILDAVDRVEQLVEKYESELPEDMEVTLAFDRSHWVESRLRTMLKSGGLGFVLVIILLTLFLDRKAAFIAALGIPVSFLGAAILMKMTGTTLNVLSMFGLIMMLGMVVDDAIIVVENVQRYISRGMEPMRAAVVGTREVAWPVVATVLTNIAAFTPLLLATGLIGQFLSIIPKVAIFALCFSLFEALVIMPSHCADWLPANGTKRSPRGNAALLRVRGLYLRGLLFALRNRYAVIGCFTVIFSFSVFIFVRIPNVMFYLHDTQEIMVRVENPPSSSLEHTTASVAQVEEAVRHSVPAHVLKNTLSMVGMDMSDPDNLFFIGDHVATVLIEYEDYSARKENALELSEIAESRVGETVTGAKQVDFLMTIGPPTGKPVDVKISGDEIPVLMEIASRTREFLSSQPGVSAATSNLVYGKPEARVEIDERKAGVFGIDKWSVAREIKALGDGLTVAKTRVGEEEAEINLRYGRGESGVFSVKSHQIPTPLGSRVPIGTIAEITDSKTPLEIRREKLRRTVTVTAEVDSKTTTSREVNANLSRHLGSLLENYPGYSFRFAGEEEQYTQAISDIKKASLIAVLLIYLILASILRSGFQPLIIMSVLPFCVTGVIVAILLRGEPMTLPAIIGMVALLGIVVNDSLLLLNFINRRAKKMPSKAVAVVFSARYRFRPIVLTTLTTFSGLFSLMFAYKGQAGILAPMAASLGFGLVFSTFVILYLVPCLYLALDDIGKRLRYFTRLGTLGLGGRDSLQIN